MSGSRKLGKLEGGLQGVIPAGSGVFSSRKVVVYATDAAKTILVSDIASGILQITGLTAGANLTTPTAAAILAAFPEMNIGESIEFEVSITTAFAGTWVAGTTVTLAGRATTAASTKSLIMITKTSATAVTWNVI